MRYLGGHLGTSVSALVDGQLDPQSADRAWAHVHGCPSCAGRVKREGWVKRQLATISVEDRSDPPDQLVGSLYDLSSRHPAAPLQLGDPSSAWAAVGEIERRERGRRRGGLAVVGAGSVSAAVLGFASLAGAPLGIAGTSSTPATTAVTRPSTPPTSSTAMISTTAHVHGRLPRSALETAGPSDLQR